MSLSAQEARYLTHFGGLNRLPALYELYGKDVVNIKHHVGTRTALNYACENTHSVDLNIVRFLVETADADVSSCNPLHSACRHGSLHVIRYLVATPGVNIQAVDRFGYTALHWACIRATYMFRTLDAVEYLVLAGADIHAVNDRGETPLHVATGSTNDQLEVVHYLVGECAANTHAVDNLGQTPLHLAGKEGKLEVVQYLVEQSAANVHAVSHVGQTPLHLASKGGKLQIVQYMVERCAANVHAVNEHGNTPLHTASRYGKLNVVMFLVEHCHADVHAVNKHGKTPLHIASHRGKLQVVHYLVTHWSIVHR
jgi:ankyrin repeat protein